MADYLALLIPLFGSGNIFLLTFILGCVLFGALNGVRGEIMKFVILVAVIGLSFLTTKFVTIVTVLIFCFYYGKKIYKGVQRQ